jgi:hypothetical protein
MAQRQSRQQAAEQDEGPVSAFDPDTPQQGEEADPETLERVQARDEENVRAGEESPVDEEGNPVAARVGGRVGAIAVTAEKNSLANKYAADAPYGAIFTADPGTAGNATNEVTGGTPAYARKAINWGAAANGVTTGSATFDVPAGTTVTYTGVCASVTAGTNDVKDRIAITSQNFATQGTLTVNYTYTQT